MGWTMDDLQIPISTSRLNSALAALSFSGERRLGRSATGEPNVTIWWYTSLGSAGAS